MSSLDDVTRLPDALPMIDAVTLGSAGSVAQFALDHARFGPGDSVLVRGAAGSIGIMAVQLALAGGARAVGVTTSSPGRGERLRALGATHVLDRSGSQQGAADAPPEFDVVIDVVGGEGLPGAFGLLAPNGGLVSVGVVGGYPPPDY
ncbi:zinc-binding dehydrogenase [Subtercola sp. YIM 133946]|uniref:zinc-binding dehydrogenase n=1 Tax=Subtercola sp. YIM 133946 TaxID=3118909 RepID=UPI002F9540C6